VQVGAIHQAIFSSGKWIARRVSSGRVKDVLTNSHRDQGSFPAEGGQVARRKTRCHFDDLARRKSDIRTNRSTRRCAARCQLSVSNKRVERALWRSAGESACLVSWDLRALLTAPERNTSAASRGFLPVLQ